MSLTVDNTIAKTLNLSVAGVRRLRRKRVLTRTLKKIIRHREVVINRISIRGF